MLTVNSLPPVDEFAGAVERVYKEEGLSLDIRHLTGRYRFFCDHGNIGIAVRKMRQDDAFCLFICARHGTGICLHRDGAAFFERS